MDFPSSRPEREARSGETFCLRQAACRGEKVSPRGSEPAPRASEGGLGRDDGKSICDSPTADRGATRRAARDRRDSPSRKDGAPTNFLFMERTLWPDDLSRTQRPENLRFSCKLTDSTRAGLLWLGWLTMVGADRISPVPAGKGGGSNVFLRSQPRTVALERDGCVNSALGT